MIYFDTAYIAKCYLREPGYEIVRRHAKRADKIACCESGRVELVSVFHRHYREGRLTREQFDVVFEQFLVDEHTGVWKWLALTPALLSAAVLEYRTLAPKFHLRAADAVHLSCARAHGLKEVFTNDRHMLAACPAFSLRGSNLLE